jgi:hypothetical protein
MTREELATMTDDEILAHYRHKHGDPYMPLSMAKKMHQAAFKWWHSTALAKKRAQEGQYLDSQPCRVGTGLDGKLTCLTHARTIHGLSH